ncbi:glycosyltransferase family 4 protein [Stieleria magnilauensis]|uniref:N-acetylgalactosamine-N, N'-diacetylbacillosaminyl-diphospho-undecaprenol 4-alpha-N-acetylgalactosaminyltransferase n=1 Tax=Stieleria magnilauensis TaxID=2527963 RepID=A0ABX5XLY4_9BACT|nr:N-acetylgalactosamine-N,N'-diacetylbacillosaminyl-diphospho-undecaprenol 4-alpha-N-acetylgalactosaminyltransferase [Planctomycetes bacterium TBK1r]
MIRVALLDTTVPGEPGSMGRYRDQLAGALDTYFSDEVEVSVKFLGCGRETLDRTPNRLRMWRRHYHIWRAARNLDVSQYDVVHLLDGSFGYAAGAVQSDCVVVTVHDVIPRLQMDGVFAGAPPVGRGARWLINQSLRGVGASSVVCSDSQSTAEDLRRYDCSPRGGIRVVPLAVESELFEGSGEVPRDVGQSTPFLFHLGNNGFYKNRAGAIEVFKRIHTSVPVRLVLAGPAPDESLRQVCSASGVAERIEFVIDPDQDALAKYYRAAAAFLFPSLYEGFGWPPLEAMAAGCPVVCSDAGSLREVVGDAGVVASCRDYDAMARGCERLLTEEAFRHETVRAGRERIKHFSRERLAERMMGVYQELLESSCEDRTMAGRNIDQKKGGGKMPSTWNLESNT